MRLMLLWTACWGSLAEVWRGAQGPAGGHWQGSADMPGACWGSLAGVCRTVQGPSGGIAGGGPLQNLRVFRESLAGGCRWARRPIEGHQKG